MELRQKEDKTMKKYLNSILSMAALLMASATVFTACSSDDNITGEQPANPTGKYTMTVNASKGGDATTRALLLEGKTLNATWAKGDKVKVYNSSNAEIGELTAETSGASTKLKGDLSTLPTDGETLTLKFLSPSYASQNGTIEHIAANCDYATATVTATVSGSAVTATDANFENKQAIVKFSLTDKTTTSAISASQLVINDGTTDYTITPASATSEIYVALPGFSGQTVTLTATAGGNTYSYEKTGVSFTNGQYYEIGVKMSPIISLSGRTYLDDELVIADGYIVTGYATAYSCKVAVADDATVTLRDVENNNSYLDPGSACPGIRCIGNATIILEGDNTVNGGGMYAGIYVPEGKTLTIRGTGSLTVTGGSYGAGIGGNIEGGCGSIVISGGTITAKGGSHGAGIGLGYSYECAFGDITISGGTVTATGYDDAPGIGGRSAYFQNITITDGVTKVTVNKGSDSTYSIGTSEIDDMEYCGAITIGGTVYLNEGNFENGGDSYLQTSPLVYQP